MGGVGGRRAVDEASILRERCASAGHGGSKQGRKAAAGKCLAQRIGASFSRTTLERMNTAATTFCPTRSPVRSSVASAFHHLSAPRSPHTPSHPSPFRPFPVRRARKQFPCSHNFNLYRVEYHAMKVIIIVLLSAIMYFVVSMASCHGDVIYQRTGTCASGRCSQSAKIPSKGIFGCRKEGFITPDMTQPESFRKSTTASKPGQWRLDQLARNRRFGVYFNR